MKDADAPTLSAHLLSHAQRFFGYPERAYRTKANVERHAVLHKVIAGLLPWRSTFATGALGDAARYTVESEVLVDEVYCRELLAAIPGFVERTAALATLSLEEVPMGPSLVYLQEATRTYSEAAYAAANRVRKAGNAALHKATGSIAGPAALSVVEDARLAVRELAIR